MKEQINIKESHDPWEEWFKTLESSEHFKKEVASGLTFICNELESDTIEE